MKRVTFRADERLIQEARERARAEHTTLSEAFRRWLLEYTGREERARRAMEVIERMQQYVDLGGRKFTRDEMNER